ncbi:hypothetical protein TNIN_161221 [Trichonephila inaurata madagascariensis]|uniref:Uncharacterized protein n=1 Tax=Trichonephila inaurata madagascariensis TaxID=2747483 RepID=A0A8X7BVG9_9ARAC|nr:hypothetical protein TNIN_161221 [Trichonephila inaurata madagascariensis]
MHVILRTPLTQGKGVGTANSLLNTRCYNFTELHVMLRTPLKEVKSCGWCQQLILCLIRVLQLRSNARHVTYALDASELLWV